MNKKEAERYAIYLWGPNAIVARASSAQRHDRFRVGYVGRANDSSGEQQPAVYLLGMGACWKDAFDQATENPAAQKQQKHIEEGRKKIQEALTAAKKEEENA